MKEILQALSDKKWKKKGENKENIKSSSQLMGASASFPARSKILSNVDERRRAESLTC